MKLVYRSRPLVVSAVFNLLAGAAIVLQGAATSPHESPVADTAAGQQPEAAFVHVEQDGKIVTERSGELALRRAPFTLVVRIPEMSVVKAQVATTPSIYELARYGRSTDRLVDNNYAIAVEKLNQRRDLFVRDDGTFHVWFQEDGEVYGFDVVTAAVGRRTVAQLTAPDGVDHGIDRYPGETLYFTFRLEGRASRAEFRRQAMKIRFTGTAANPPPAPNAVNGVVPRRVSGNIRAPAKLRDVPPVYPAIAQSARVQGFVSLDIVVGTDGSVLDAKVVKSIPLLDQAAIDAVKQWKFEPPRVEGRIAPVIMTVLVNFALQ